MATSLGRRPVLITNSGANVPSLTVAPLLAHTTANMKRTHRGTTRKNLSMKTLMTVRSLRKAASLEGNNKSETDIMSDKDNTPVASQESVLISDEGRVQILKVTIPQYENT